MLNEKKNKKSKKMVCQKVNAYRKKIKDGRDINPLLRVHAC